MGRRISAAASLAWIGILFVASPAGAASGSGGDDFDDGIIDPALWGPSVTFGSGVLTETNGRLEYTAPSNPTSYDEIHYYWRGTSPTFGSSWGMWLDIHIETESDQNDQVTSFGLFAENANDPNDYIYSEMYSSHLQTPPLRRGFFTESVVNGESVGFGDSGGLWLEGGFGGTPIDSGALQILYNAETGKVKSFYSLTGGGEDWILFSTFGIAGAGGGSANADWEMDASDRFMLAIYGYSSNEIVVSGQMWGDNFTMLNTPESATATLLSFGLIAITLLRRRSRR